MVKSLNRQPLVNSQSELINSRQLTYWKAFAGYHCRSTSSTISWFAPCSSVNVHHIKLHFFPLQRELFQQSSSCTSLRMYCKWCSSHRWNQLANGSSDVRLKHHNMLVSMRMFVSIKSSLHFITQLVLQSSWLLLCTPQAHPGYYVSMWIVRRVHATQWAVEWSPCEYYAPLKVEPLISRSPRGVSVKICKNKSTPLHLIPASWWNACVRDHTYLLQWSYVYLVEWVMLTLIELEYFSSSSGTSFLDIDSLSLSSTCMQLHASARA